jgi:hypothetical protein
VKTLEKYFARISAMVLSSSVFSDLGSIGSRCRSANKSPGPDELHPRLLKTLAKSLTKPSCIIFNQSLRLKMTPKQWKKVTISAIFKKGNRSMAGN